jgi:thioredoxin 1
MSQAVPDQATTNHKNLKSMEGRMQVDGRKIVFALIITLGLALLGQPLPNWAQSSPPQQNRPALYEFGAGYCASCKEMEKVMAALQASHGDQVEFRMVYLDQEKPLFQQYKIMLIPTQVFFDASGQEVDRHMGALTKQEVLQKLKELKLIE